MIESSKRKLRYQFARECGVLPPTADKLMNMNIKNVVDYLYLFLKQQSDLQDFGLVTPLSESEKALVKQINKR